MSNRVATFAIKGFVYQFNKTLQSILNNDADYCTTIEGIIEDIDIKTPTGIKAIQCKYHGTLDKYRISDIQEPILQFLLHYVANENATIKYILYAHFGGENEREEVLTQENIKSMILTQNKNDIVNYISRIKPPVDDLEIKNICNKKRRTEDDKNKIIEYYKKNPPDVTDIVNDFLGRIEFQIGKSYEDLIEENTNLLTSELNYNREDVETLFYPNTIQRIAHLSTKSNEADRIITKFALLENIKKIKKSAVTRWTKELSSYKKILKKRLEQLDTHLKENNRLRYFVIDSSIIEGFEENIVNFIHDYINKYHFKFDNQNAGKPLHCKTPLFCLDCSKDIYFDILERLHEKDISFNDGYRGKKFYDIFFLKEPLRVYSRKKFDGIEFKIRICCLQNNNQNEIRHIINTTKCDDLFLVAKSADWLNTKDLELEELEVKSFQELKYLLKLSKNID